MPISSCCVQTFTWDGTPAGKETTLASNPAYVTGTNKDAAVLIIHDLLGWKYNNVRLLADHYAREADVTVFVPDFFDGWTVDWDLVEQERWAELLPKLAEEKFAENNAREVRAPDIEACARVLKAEGANGEGAGKGWGFKRVGAVGFCYGGWAVAHLGSREREEKKNNDNNNNNNDADNRGEGKKLVDAISMGHPTFLTREDVDKLAVPIQILAPEFDEQFTPDFKRYTFDKLLQLNLPFEYVHFPGVKHGCLVRGRGDVPREREAMAQAKNSVVAWFKMHLH